MDESARGWTQTGDRSLEDDIFWSTVEFALEMQFFDQKVQDERMFEIEDEMAINNVETCV